MHPFIASLDKKEAEALLARSSAINYGPRRTLVRAGAYVETVSFLIDGKVAVCHRGQEGMDVLVRLAKRPSIFGLAEALSQCPHLEHVRSLTRATVVKVPADAISHLVSAAHTGCHPLLLQLSQDLLQTTRRVRSMAFFDSRARLADLLLEYAEFAGEKCADGISIELRLSQEELASNLSVTRQALGRSIDRFRRAGLISKENARYLIHNLEQLRAHGSKMESFR